MSGSSRVIPSADLGDFFRTEISEARTSLGIEISEIAEFYVVNLLCDFARRGDGPIPGQEPLALMYKRALEASTGERIQLLRNLGDQALYVAGFFAEFVERSLVDLGYYIAMGGNAYSNVSDIIGAQRHGELFAELYWQLARKFGEIVDLLHQIAEKVHDKADRDADLLRLYDRWLRTGSERVRRLLIEKGLVPTTMPTDYEQ